METKEIVINSVLVKLQQALTIAQLQMAEDAVRASLKGYRIEAECTELSTGLDDNLYILDVFRANKRLEGCVEGTVSQYYMSNRNFLEAVDKNYRYVTKDDIKMYLARYSIGKKQNSVANMKRYLSAFYTWMHDEGLIPTNPVKAVKGIRPEEVETKYFSAEEEVALRDAAAKRPIRDRAIIDFLFSTGVRVGELERLCRQDVDLAKGSIKFRSEKSRRYRTVFLDTRAKRRICDYFLSREDSLEALFVAKMRYLDSNGEARYRPMRKHDFEALTKEIGVAAGIKDKICTVHIFRKTFATRLAERGCPLEIVQELLGHADVGTTSKHYVGKSEARIRREFDRCLIAA